MADMANKSLYGGLPVTNSINVQPRDQISDLVVAPFNSITSGATNKKKCYKKNNPVCFILLQLGVPETVSFSVVLIFRLRETPKSVSLTSPVLVVRILAAFRSQWATSFACKYSKPFNILMQKEATSFSGNAPNAFNVDIKDPFSAYLHNYVLSK